jgi:hypothetical protein
VSPDIPSPDCSDLCFLEEIRENSDLIDQVVDLLLGVLYTVATYVVKIIDLFDGLTS